MITGVTSAELEKEINDFLSHNKLDLDRVKLSYSTVQADKSRHDTDASYIHFAVILYE
jgi:hypothetical protein